MRRWCRTQRPMCCSTGESVRTLKCQLVAHESAKIYNSSVWAWRRKSSEESVRVRQKVVALANLKEPSLLQFYISREWLNKFNTFAEPGPISNHTFLCQHGGNHTLICLTTLRKQIQLILSRNLQRSDWASWRRRLSLLKQLCICHIHFVFVSETTDSYRKLAPQTSIKQVYNQLLTDINQKTEPD